MLDWLPWWIPWVVLSGGALWWGISLWKASESDEWLKHDRCQRRAGEGMFAPNESEWKRAADGGVRPPPGWWK